MDSVTSLKMNIKATMAFLSFHGVLFYSCYSISNPDSVQSMFNLKPYQILMKNAMVEHQLMAFITEKGYEALCLLVPVEEVKKAYDILVEFVNPLILHAKMKHLLYITMHVQVGMGFLGINFLRKEQERKNTLIRLEDEVPAELKQLAKEEGGASGVGGGTISPPKKFKDVSKKFRRSAGPFIFYVALPYMVQIIFFGGLNMFAFHCFRDDLHRTIRLNGLFDEDGSRFVATANVKTNYRSPGGMYLSWECVVFFCWVF